jgi:hypothetical protein
MIRGLELEVQVQEEGGKQALRGKKEEQHTMKRIKTRQRSLVRKGCRDGYQLELRSSLWSRVWRDQAERSCCI